MNVLSTTNKSEMSDVNIYLGLQKALHVNLHVSQLSQLLPYHVYFL